MIENPMDSMPSFDRVSIRAVLVSDGQDPRTALAEAGIFDPIEIRVVLGDDLDLSAGIQGDAVTPNLTAVLEPDQADDPDHEDDPDHAEYWESSSNLPAGGPGAGMASRLPETATVTTRPEALGQRPFAPRATKFRP